MPLRPSALLPNLIIAGKDARSSLMFVFCGELNLT